MNGKCCSSTWIQPSMEESIVIGISIYSRNAIGQKKYKELSKVVKCAFSLSHGNADIERRFSVSRWSLTKNKNSTSERTQNATLLIKDELRLFENNPHLVPMTAKLISMGRNAYRHYIMHLEEEKKLKEEQEKKKKEELRIAQEAEEENKQAKDSREKIIEMEKKILKSKSDKKNNSKAFEEIFDN